MVELSKIQKPEPKDVILTVRTTKENKGWMDKNNISPSLFFDEAIVDLKKKMKKNIHRNECAVCGNPTKEINIGMGLDTFSFCCPKCMKTYMTNHPKGEGLEVTATRLYVK
jgi:hypothetical protein